MSERELIDIQIRPLYVGGKSFSLMVNPSARTICPLCCPERQVPVILKKDASDLVHQTQSRYDWDYLFTARVVHEYTKFLKLKCNLNDTHCTKIMPSPLIDMVWSEHMQNTHAYDQFCSKMRHQCKSPGPFCFIHRIPPNSVETTEATKRAYIAEFFESPSKLYWGEYNGNTAREKSSIRCDCLAVEIIELKDVPVCELILSCNGVQLDASKTLHEWGVVHGSTVYMEVRPKWEA